MDGIINICKPKGKTSHDIVNIVRRLFQMKRVGHTGTLDPDAEGVLPICLGKGCKAADMLTATDKAYRAEVLLGVVTDTQDISGKILKQSHVDVSKEQIIRTVESFVGEQMQTPPMYSAVKVGGKKLYELARAGVEIEREPRKIEIFSIRLGKIDIENSEFIIDVECSKGTYIRTLCNDIGEALGCGATMKSLIRTKSGRFLLEDSVTLDELETMIKNGEENSRIISVDEVFDAYEKITVDQDNEGRIRNGISPRINYVAEGKIYRVYGLSGEFLCLSKGEVSEDGRKVLKMIKSFYG